jgi:hypothetical protein
MSELSADDADVMELEVCRAGNLLSGQSVCGVVF